MRQVFDSMQDMPLFVEVVRAGSYRDAALRLGIPLSTLSRRIASLERRLDMPLLVRTTRSVALVPSAKTFFERCLDVMEAAQGAQDALVGRPNQEALLRIAMPVDFGVQWLGSAVADFADHHPGLRVDMDLSSHAVDLMRDPVDLAFRIGKPMDDRIVARKLGDISSGVFGSPGLLRRLPKITTADQLKLLPCLDLRTAQGSMPWKVGAFQWGAPPGVCALGANSVALVRKFAEEGRGLAVLPLDAVGPSEKAGRLVRVLAHCPTNVWPVYVMTARRSVPKIVSQLIAHVRQTMATWSLPGR